MTEFEANRLLLMLQYNFAGFYPQDVRGAAIVKGTWLDEMLKYDAQRGEEAVKKLIQICHYPPKIADFREVIGVAVTRDEMQARLPGPVFGTQEGFDAMYTADMSRVDRLMAELDEELRTGRFKKTREEALSDE